MQDFSYSVRLPPETTEVHVGPLQAIPIPVVAETGCLVADEAAMAASGAELSAFAARAVRRPAEPILVRGGEALKEIGAASSMWDALFARGLDRRSLVLAAGGGSVLDACAFVAATFLRGVPFAAVPTTLLGQVDAAIGGKCGLNAGRVKNQIGLVRQPRFVAIDPAFALGLPEPAYRSGLGELAKCGLLAGGALHALLSGAAPAIRARDPAALEEAVVLALRYKAGIVARDPLDLGERAILNAGHTIGHAIEAAALSRGLDLPHGVAVAIGLVIEARAHDAADSNAVRAMVSALGLPCVVPFALDEDAARALVERDKKRRGVVVTLPVIEAPGSVTLREVAAARIVGALTAGG